MNSIRGKPNLLLTCAFNWSKYVLVSKEAFFHRKAPKLNGHGKLPSVPSCDWFSRHLAIDSNGLVSSQDVRKSVVIEI